MLETYSQVFTSRTEDGNSTGPELLENPYGYTPNVPLSVIFLALFVIVTVLHVGQSIFYRRWFLLYTVVLSGLLEIVGWIGRVWSSHDVLQNNPYMMQIVCTIIAPTPLLAANFVMFGRIIRRLGTTYSRLRPRLYTKIFFSCDIIALVVQSVGGAIASGNDIPQSTVDLGSNIMLGGIIFQLIIIASFCVLAYMFFRAHHEDRPVRSKGPEETPRGKIHGKIQLLIYAIGFNTALLFVRAIYRTAELADGFQGKIITTEWPFLVFDALFVLLATFAYNVFHVGRMMETEEEFMLNLKASQAHLSKISDIPLTGERRAFV
ncbi:hypothetical protein D9758_011528 [Tetrapyrgos nigripes]|uniref:RTA1-like protein n=1 Tax=Tetrapyrgos nigripes TaxID=182062 RepID=A0A8H5FRE2_9AGAR|nr:hypothetical protein D9758_011528 [Tetrapyrgos nigripes]